MTCDGVREKVWDVAFGLLDDVEQLEVMAHVSSCEACRNALAEARSARELLPRWRGAEPPPGLAERTIAAARAAAGQGPVTAEPEAAWFNARSVAAIAASLLLLLAGAAALELARVGRIHGETREAYLFGQPEMDPAGGASYRLLLRDGRSAAPLVNADLSGRLLAPGGKVAWEGSARTGEEGIAEIAPRPAAELPEGRYTLEVSAPGAVGAVEVARDVVVRRAFRILVTTDKPLYQPGQVVHMRALALATGDLHPVADREVVLEVRDAKGNKVFKAPTRTSRFGIAAADFTLADQVNLGSYAVAASIGETTSERSVTVERYVLPRFKIVLATGRGYYLPGETIEGEVGAAYTFGKPVSGGKVRLVASTMVDALRPFGEAEGSLDGSGSFRFAIPVRGAFVGQEMRGGGAYVSLEATVTDTAGHVQSSSRDLTVSSEPLVVELFPESGTLVPGVPNVVYVVTAYPDGAPARTTLTIEGQRHETSESGIAVVELSPRPAGSLRIAAEDGAGRRVEVERELRAGDATETLLLRTDRALYRAGETASLTVLSGGSGRVFVDVVFDRRTLLTKGLDLREGRGELTLDLPPDLSGTLELHAYRITASGDMQGDAKLVQVARPSDLDVRVELDRESYRPAERAILELAVTRRGGDPVQAALSLSAVDEAVFALQEMRPGLERVFFALQEEILKPRFEIHGHAPDAPAALLHEDGSGGAERAASVLLAGARGGTPPERTASPSWSESEQRAAQERQQGRGRVAGLALLLPSLLAFATGIPLLLHGAGRVIRRRRIVEHAAGDTAFQKAMTRTSIAWALAFYLPLCLAFLAGTLASEMHLWRAAPTVALMTGGGAAILMLGIIALCVRGLRAVPLSAALPLTRKLVAFLPATYVLTLLGIAGIALATDVTGFALPDDLAGRAIAALFLQALLVVGALALLGRGAARVLTLPRALWLAASRPALVLLPLLVPALMLFSLAGGRRAAPVEMMMGDVAGGAFQKELAMPMAAREAGPAGAGGAPQAKGEAEPPRVRRHFPETLLWLPELVTDAQGKAKVELPLADSITTWRVATSAVAADGALGAIDVPLVVFQDFFVDVDVPVALTQHDLVTIPVAVHNYLKEPQEVVLTMKDSPGLAVDGPPVQRVRVGAGEVAGAAFRVEAREPGSHALLLEARGSRLADAVERRVRVLPDGEEIVQAWNGRLGENVAHDVPIPAEAIDGATDLLVKIYPGAFSQVVEGQEGIFQMPHGCFEQTSSTTYPNVLVLDYMKETGQVKPEVELKALGFINLGYQRLVSYEVSGGGFSWFGEAPAHNVLTAFGLMELSDMARVADVDPAVLERTRDWLYSGQDADGSWSPTEGGIAEGAIDAYRGAVLRTTAYIAWTLAESGLPDARLDRAMAYLLEHRAEMTDPYTLALAASALAAGKHASADALLAELVKQGIVEDKLVHWDSTGTGATHSSGAFLDVEATALAARALLRSQSHVDVAHGALAWLVEKKDSRGTWGSTQATVHAMRALLAGAGSSRGVERDLHVTVAVNGAAAGELTITPAQSDVFRLVSLRDHVREGTNRVVLESDGKGELAYQIVATHYLAWRESDRSGAAGPGEEETLAIDVRYDRTSLATEDLLGCEVTLLYRREGAARMTLVDLGIPPGFEIEQGELERLRESGIIARHETTGRQAILYFDTIPGMTPLKFRIAMRAKLPVKAKTPPSTVYQYYEPEVRAVAQPVELTVI